MIRMRQYYNPNQQPNPHLSNHLLQSMSVGLVTGFEVLILTSLSYSQTFSGSTTITVAHFLLSSTDKPWSQVHNWIKLSSNWQQVSPHLSSRGWEQIQFPKHVLGTWDNVQKLTNPNWIKIRPLLMSHMHSNSKHTLWALFNSKTINLGQYWSYCKNVH
jgi:hypothetical protein